MGFLDGLTTLLGGFSDVKQIDKEGFDFREKRKAQQLERDRSARDYSWDEEDRLQKQAEDVAAGQEGEYDPEAFASQIPGEVGQAQKLWMARQLPGRVAERKSSIQAAKAYSDFERDRLKGGQRLEEVGARGDEAQELARLNAKLQSGQTMSEYERARIGVLQQAVSQRGSGGGRPSITKVPTQQNGQAGTLIIDNRTGEERFVPAADTAPTRARKETLGIAMNAYKVLMDTYDSMGGQPEDGIEARALGVKRQAQSKLGYAPQVAAYTTGLRGFTPLMARQVGHVGVLTELDVQSVREMFPGEGDTEQEKRLKKAQIEAIMSGRAEMPFQFGQQGGKPIGYIDENGEFTPMGGGGDAPRGAQSSPGRGASAGGRPIVQQSKSTGAWRHSFDGGRTWQPGRP